MRPMRRWPATSQVAVLLARPYKPKDKAEAEVEGVATQAVQVAIWLLMG